MLQVNFVNKDLQHLYENPELGKGLYPRWVVETFIEVVSVMQSVDTVEQINSFWDYRVWPKKGNMKGIWAARLNKQRRLEFTRWKMGEVQVVNLKRISNHYAK